MKYKSEGWSRTSSSLAVIARCCLVTFTSACVGDAADIAPGLDTESDTTFVQSAIGGPANVSIYYDASFTPTSSSWSDFKDDLFGLIDGLTPLAGYVSTAVAAVPVALTVLRFLGILSTPVSDVQRLAADFAAVSTGITWQAASDFVNTWYPLDVSAMETLADNGTIVTLGSTYDSDTQKALNAMLTPSAWERTKIGSSNDSSTDGETLSHVILGGWNVVKDFKWKSAISARPGAGSKPGLVFDWRLGAPYLLTAIADRLMVMAQIDINFTTNHRFDTEISIIHNGVSDYYEKMRQGIQCATRNYVYYAPGRPGSATTSACEAVCADIYTGVASVSDITPTVQGITTAATCGVLGTQVVADLANRTAYSIVTQMPLYDLKAMKNALYKIRNPTADLTESAPRIVDLNSGKCIDTVGGSSDYGTDLTLAPCDASRPSQQWRYNRETGQIVNPNWGMCIDQRWGTNTGTLVGIWGCDTPHATVSGGPPNVVDNLAQRWTYSLESGELYSAVGTPIRSFNGSVITVGFLNTTGSELNAFLGWK